MINPLLIAQVAANCHKCVELAFRHIKQLPILQFVPANGSNMCNLVPGNVSNQLPRQAIVA